MAQFQIFVKGLTGSTSTLTVSEETSIETLMHMIKDKTGVGIDEQRLIYVSKQLQKGFTLRDYNIQKHSTIFLVLRLLGGSNEETEKRHDPNDESVTLTTAPDMITKDDDPDNLRAQMPCGHAIGPESLTAYCRSLIDSGKFQFFCPYVGATATDRCNGEWQYHDIRKLGLLSDEETQYFERKISENYLLLAQGVQECPKCQSFCERRDHNRGNVICSICTRRDKKEYSFCWFCLKQTTHYKCLNTDCHGIEPRLAILRNAPLKKIWEISSVPSIRACPDCGLLVEHRDKCKHMKCLCTKEFCFVCLKMRLNGEWQCGNHATVCKVAPIQTAIPSIRV